MYQHPEDSGCTRFYPLLIPLFQSTFILWTTQTGFHYMKTYLQSGLTYKSNTPLKGSTDIEKYISDTLIKFGVPHVPPCCLQITAFPAMEAVRWNPTLLKLEHYDAPTATWIVVV